VSKKYIRVDTETPWESITDYQEIDGDETQAQLDSIAADIFNNNCTYGHQVVDEEDVPEAER
jgi:hypothetical protein